MKRPSLILFLFALLLTLAGVACHGGGAVLTAAAAPDATDEARPAAPAGNQTNLPLIMEGSSAGEAATTTYAVVDTGQTACYDGRGAVAECPAEGTALSGQDAQYAGNAPAYTANGDGTVTDDVTGLIWQQSPDSNGDGQIGAADKFTYEQALAYVESLTLAGYDDWRLPTIKELYSLIDFSGLDPSGYEGSTAGLQPFVDTAYFDFAYGDTGAGERIIDAQYASSTVYTALSNGSQLLFGVNFADGRIKGYWLNMNGREKTFYAIAVRGAEYGGNDFVDNGDGTVTDRATGLTWTQDDSGSGLNWEAALNYCQSLESAGYDDWRLPNVKELQSIVDYDRSPDSTGSAAIDPLFHTTQITNEAGQADYAAYWSSTTHANTRNGLNAAYVSFGRALGYMNGHWSDVHGAGAQRSDPKSGDPAAYPTGHGPQGDAIRIDNYVRCVRDGSAGELESGGPVTQPATVTGGQPAPTGSTQPAGSGEQPGTPPEQGPDLAAAAQTLGVPESALRRALGAPPPDLEAAGRELGVTVEALADALGVPLPGQ